MQNFVHTLFVWWALENYSQEGKLKPPFESNFLFFHTNELTVQGMFIHDDEWFPHSSHSLYP